jgi:exopolyphosphatase/guanosine-5'-triphosphate,3'-diphosphate pyrophosphatase
MRVSVIDLGFNSVKMVNYDVKNDGSFQPYRQEAVKVRLGEGMHRTGYIGREPAQRTIDALRLFRDIVSFDSIRHVLPVATSAVRDAGNRADFLRQVEAQTGFRFRVLSGDEEAFYSYVGALQSTCLPTALFFDIGGGSLELVYTENYSIKKVKSYPLGALRLSQMFGAREGVFTKKQYGRMIKHILDLLPDKKELGSLSIDTELVGVGGALRALARYDQDVRGYELDKIHNYRMGYDSVSSMAKELYRVDDAGELAGIEAIGANRAETIVAGSAVISAIMSKLGFDTVVVSARGLREGVMSVFARDPRVFYSGGINNERARAFVTFACQQEVLPRHTFGFVKPLVAAGLLREKERTILAHAIKRMATLPAIANYNNLFYMMMDEDNAFLTHREQLILALAIVHNRKDKIVDFLFSRYRSILEPQNMKSTRKISACLTISEILERAKAVARVSVLGKEKEKERSVSIRLSPPAGQFVPSVLLANALKNFEEAFSVSATCQIVSSVATNGGSSNNNNSGRGHNRQRQSNSGSNSKDEAKVMI